MLRSTFIPAVLALTLFSQSYAAIAATNEKDAMIVKLVPPSERAVTVSTGAISIADALKAVSADSGITVLPEKIAADVLARQVKVTTGAAGLWARLGEITSAANVSFSPSNGVFVVKPSKGEIIGHAVVGPALVVLYNVPDEGRATVTLHLSAYYHPFEVATDAQTPAVADARIRAPGIAPISVSMPREQSAIGSVSWIVAPKGDVSGMKWPTSVDGSLVVTVRSALYRLTVPIAADSAASNGDLSIRAVDRAIGKVHNADMSQTFEVSWSSGLAPEDELKLSALNDNAMVGAQPSDKEMRWFRQKMQEARRFTLVDANILSHDGTRDRPKAFFYRTQGVSRLDVELCGPRGQLGGARAEIIVGVERQKEFKFSVPVSQN